MIDGRIINPFPRLDQAKYVEKGTEIADTQLSQVFHDLLGEK